MLCESCQKYDATVHQVQIRYLDDGEPTVQEEHLCPQCAKAKGLRIAEPANYPDLVQKLSKSLLGSLQQFPGLSPASETTTEACPECGWTQRDFRQTSRFGCPHDYEHFSDFVDEVLERIHGFSEHPQADDGAGRLEQLRSELDSAVLAEDYESAARLRDEIRQLEAGLENGQEPA